MDLKDVIVTVRERAMEATNAFHAGHHDVAEQYLLEQLLEIQKYFNEKPTPAGDVTESTSSSPDAGPPEEKPAAVPGASAQPAVGDPAAAAQQKALDQAGP